MSRNNYWVLQLKGQEPELFTSWAECEEKQRKASETVNENKEKGSSRVICRGFHTWDEAMDFMAGKRREKPISEKVRAWLEEYKTREGQLRQDTELDASALSLGELPKCCAYVDGSYDPESKSYGFGVVFICDGKAEKFYGGGKEEELAAMGCGAGELLACMEAIKHAESQSLSEITIIYDSQLIAWAYRGCGKEMLTLAAGQYMYDLREKMEIKVESIKGQSHEAGEAPGIALADKLARKGAGIADQECV